MATGGTDAFDDLLARMTRSEQILAEVLAELRLSRYPRMSDFGQAPARPAFAAGVRRFKFRIPRS